MDDVQIQQVEQTVRFQHPEKLLTTVARLAEPVIATILGLDVATYRETKQQLEEHVRAAARELLTDPAVADSVDRLPFRPGTTVVGIGDSNTDDLLSWLEILRCLLELRRPQDRIRVLNAAVAAQTTSMAPSSLVRYSQIGSSKRSMMSTRSSHFTTVATLSYRSM
jgi:acyl-CoA thioesterase-1